MAFLNPMLLSLGLACVAVPILIHILMRRKRQPIAWGAMQFLLQAYQQQRKRLRLEQILLLASRCLIIALLALALGKPVIGSIREGLASPSRTLYIVLDNSLTQQTTPAGEANGLARAKEQAITALNELDMQRGDRAALVLAGSPVQSVVLPPASDLAQVRRLIEQTEATDSAADLAGAMEAVRGAIASERADSQNAGTDAIIYVASGMRAGSANLTKPLPTVATDAAVQRPRILATSPTTTAVDNVAVRTVEPLRALVLATREGQTGPDAGVVPVRVELVRSGPGVGGVAISQVTVWAANAASVNNSTPSEQAERATINWTSGQSVASATVSVKLPTGTAGGDVLLLARCDSDSLAGDNIAAAPVTLRAGVSVAVVGSLSAAGNRIDSFTPADWFTLALAPAEAQAWQRLSGEVRVTGVESRELLGVSVSDAPANVREADAIIVTQPHELDDGAWRVLRAANARGAMLLIVPSDREQTQLWADELSETLGTGWKLSREATDLMQGRDEGAAVSAVTSASASDDLLALLRPELPELLRSVRVQRVMQVVEGATAGQALLSLDGLNQPLVLATRPTMEKSQPGGWVVLWLAPPALAWTDLPAKPLMVPLVQELVRQGVGKSASSRVSVAGGTLANVRGSTEAAKQLVWREDASTLDANLATLNNAVAPRAAGLWSLRDAGGQRVATAAVNANTEASDTAVTDTQAVEKWLTATGAEVTMVSEQTQAGDEAQASTLGASRQPPPISLPLLIAAAVVALLEALMARWFSHATVEKGAEGATA